MVAQKYGIAISPAALPPRLWLLVGGFVLGWFIALVLGIGIAAFIPIAVIVLIVCLLVRWFQELTRVAFILAAIAIGIGTGSRFNQMLPPRSNSGAEMLAWIDGSIEDIVRIDQQRFTCIAVASVDPKYAPPQHSLRMLVSAPLPKVVPRVGDRIVGTAYVRPPEEPWFPGDFSQWQYCAVRSIHLVARLVTSPALLPSDKPISLLERWRESLACIVEQIFHSQDTRQLANAMVLGKRDQLGSLTRELFTLTGTAHVLSVSGFHVGIIAAVFMLITAPLANRRLLRVSIVLCGTWLYVLLSGAAPPSVRAGTAAIIAITMLALGRWVTGFQILMITVLVMLLIDPLLVLSPSFQLSVSAMIGITTLGKELSLRMLPHVTLKWMRPLVRLVSSTAAAMLLTAPVVAVYFGQIPLAGIVANVLVVPLATAFIVATIVAIAAGALTISLGVFYAGVAETLSAWMLGILHAVSSVEETTISADSQTAFLAAALIPCAFYLVHSWSIRHFVFRTSIVAVVLSALVLLSGSWKSSTLERSHSRGIEVNIRHIGAHAVAIGVRQYSRNADWRGYQRAFERYLQKLSSTKVYLVTPTEREWNELRTKSLRQPVSIHLVRMHDASTFSQLFR
jgi:ComEC/Rec2-related protein